METHPTLANLLHVTSIISSPLYLHLSVPTIDRKNMKLTPALDCLTIE